MDTGVRLRVLVLGGSSEVGIAIVQRLAQESDVDVLLLGGDYHRMAAVVDALKATGRGHGEFDGLDTDEVETHAHVIACAFERLEHVDLVILCAGALGAQSGLDADPTEVARILTTNVLGCGLLLWHTVLALRAQGDGTVVVLPSVAAEHSRPGGVVQDAAKAALDTLAQGLAAAVVGTHVRVLVVGPGMVQTGLDTGSLNLTPEAVADATIAALHGSAVTSPTVTRA